MKLKEGRKRKRKEEQYEGKEGKGRADVKEGKVKREEKKEE